MTTKTIKTPSKAMRPGRKLRVTDAKIASSQKQSSPALSRKPALAPTHSDGPRVTKHAQLIQLLSRSEGASIEDMMQTTDWQQHSVRGFLAGTVKRKMGLALSSSKAEGHARRYRIETRRGR